jgi:two-component system, chemotaxis family, chemotaxis protein CheY
MGARAQKILVVDDDAAIRQVLILALEDAGYKVVEASGGLQAIAMIRRRHFDLIVLDINMPDVTGYDVLAAVRSMPARESTPVFIVSANGHDPSGMIREVAGGAVGRLTKPFNLAELEHAVSAALSESTEQRESRHHSQTRAAEMYRSIIDLRMAGDDDDDEPVDPRPRRGLLRSR